MVKTENTKKEGQYFFHPPKHSHSPEKLGVASGGGGERKKRGPMKSTECFLKQAVSQHEVGANTMNLIF